MGSLYGQLYARRCYKGLFLRPQDPKFPATPRETAYMTAPAGKHSPLQHRGGAAVLTRPVYIMEAFLGTVGRIPVLDEKILCIMQYRCIAHVHAYTCAMHRYYIICHALQRITKTEDGARLTSAPRVCQEASACTTRRPGTGRWVMARSRPATIENIVSYDTLLHAITRGDLARGGQHVNRSAAPRVGLLQVRAMATPLAPPCSRHTAY
jgi:hypothetical protein